MEKNRNEVTKAINEQILDSSKAVGALLDDCPVPSNVELKALLSVIAAVETRIGLEMLMDAQTRPKGFKQTELALKILRESRNCIIEAAKIEADTDKSLIDSYVEEIKPIEGTEKG